MRLKICFIALAVFICVGSVPVETEKKEPEKKEPENLLLKEMTALDKAFKITIDALVLNQSDKIVPAFAEMEKIREQLEKIKKEDGKISLPKNQNMFRTFVRMDKRFHRDVEILLEAAKENRRGIISRQTYRLLNMCVRCHSMFRK